MNECKKHIWNAIGLNNKYRHTHEDPFIVIAGFFCEKCFDVKLKEIEDYDLFVSVANFR